MLHRSLSSRRRRASRSAASSPNRLGAPTGSSASRSPRGSISAASGISALGVAGGTSPGGSRRASISVGEGAAAGVGAGAADDLSVPSLTKTSPRGSVAIPTTDKISPGALSVEATSPRNSRLSLAPDHDAVEYDRGHRKSIAPELLSGEVSSPRSSSRHTLAPDKSRSPRNSLAPESGGEFNRRSSLAPDFNRSPRGSLVPDYNRSPRNSLVPDSGGYNRSPRNSLCPDGPTPSRSPRHSLVPDGDGFNRSPRPSIHDTGEYSRSSRENDGYSRSPRPSLIPDNGDIGRGPRPSLIPSDIEFNRNPRPSMIPSDVEFNRSPRTSLVPDGPEMSRSPRPSLIPSDVEFNRSPRTSLVPDGDREFGRGGRGEGGLDLNRSPRGSIGGESIGRSPRGSYVQEMGSVSAASRSPRGSIGPDTGAGGGASPYNRSPRGSLGADLNRSPRNSLSPRGSLTGRASVDLVVAGPSRAGSQRSTSPYRGGGGAGMASASGGGGPSGARGGQGGYNSSPWTEAGGSRRASSNPSQVSGDDRRQLCAEHTKLAGESSTGLVSYGSVMYQLKDANIEASSTCDFVLRAMRIVYKTVVVTVILVCLTAMPIIMLFMGVQYLRDCPKEPHLPVYMVVGGVLGTVRMVWLVWRQSVSRRYARLGAGLGAAAMESDVATSIGVRIACGGLTLFLVVWFCLGSYWTLHIMWPAFAGTLYEPNTWCDKRLYIFSLVHLAVCYSIIGVIVVMALGLSCYQLLLCPLVMRYK